MEKQTTTTKSIMRGRFEAILVATLTMISAAVYITKLCQWILEDGMKDYLKDIYLEEEKEHVKHMCYTMVKLSIAGNALSFLTSLPLFLVSTSNPAVNQKRKYAVIPYIIWHIVLLVTSANRLVLTSILSEHISLDIVSIRGFGIVTLILSLFLIGHYYWELRKPLVDGKSYYADINENFDWDGDSDACFKVELDKNMENKKMENV